MPDDRDRCPNTPIGRTVDENGCELDGDGDCVVDALDQCPGTPAGRSVNEAGCELDGDADGVVARLAEILDAKPLAAGQAAPATAASRASPRWSRRSPASTRA